MAFNLARDDADDQKKVKTCHFSREFNFLRTKFEQWHIILIQPSENHVTGSILANGPHEFVSETASLTPLL